MKNNFPYNSIHFTGIFGSGMSAIAQYLAALGIHVTGSDRLNDSPDTERIKQHLLNSGCTIFPQDGSGISQNTGAVCVSTAIEETNPDIAAARTLGIQILHRSDVLALLVKNSRCIAIAGTSGKSTVTAMVFELLTACGMSPSLISGAALRSLEEKGMLGNAFLGESDLLVIEADESDGTLVKYKPYASLILNLSKDHKPETEVLAMFQQLASQSTWVAINADDSKLKLIRATTTFGFNENVDFKGDKKKNEWYSSTISVNQVDYTLPLPGEYNGSNLLAALCVCKFLGCPEEHLVKASANYKGVDRRFTIYRTKSGVTVIDDFAHNPAKIRAAVTAAKKLSDKLIILYQPHGFGPTRFLRNEYVKTFREIVRPSDMLCLLPIYYAGGTAVKDITSQDIIDLIKCGMGNGAGSFQNQGECENNTPIRLPFNAMAVDGREEAITVIQQHVQKDSCIVIMGARDPSLSSFVSHIVECF